LRKIPYQNNIPHPLAKLDPLYRKGPTGVNARIVGQVLPFRVGLLMGDLDTQEWMDTKFPLCTR
jgi:hypothetical protein